MEKVHGEADLSSSSRTKHSQYVRKILLRSLRIELCTRLPLPLPSQFAIDNALYFASQFRLLFTSKRLQASPLKRSRGRRPAYHALQLPLEVSKKSVNAHQE
ncbi:30S ribosomal protein [Dirofilaria immitis]